MAAVSAPAPVHDDGPPPKARSSAWRHWLMREIGPVAAVLVVTVGLWLFLVVADEMGEGDTSRIDNAILFGLRQAGDPHTPLGPHWLHLAAADITAFGSVTGLIVLVGLIAGFFAAFRRYREAAILIAAPISGSFLSQWLKQFFGRERPPTVLHSVEVMNP